MSSRSLGLLAGFFVSQARSSPASCRLMSSGSSVRKRMRPSSRSLSGRFSIFRSSNESINKMSPGPDTPFQATLRPRLHSIVPPTRGQGRWSCPKFINHKGHEGARRKSLEFAPSRSEEHTSELQSRGHLVCRLLLEKKKRENTKLEL